MGNVTHTLASLSHKKYTWAADKKETEIFLKMKNLANKLKNMLTNITCLRFKGTKKILKKIRQRAIDTIK